MTEDREKPSQPQIVDLMGALKRGLAQHPNATPAPPAEEKKIEPESALERYGVEWRAPNLPVCIPLPDGYWTPFHIAQARIAADHQALVTAEERIKALEAMIVDYYEAGQEVAQGGLLNRAATSRAEVYNRASRVTEQLRDEARALIAAAKKEKK